MSNTPRTRKPAPRSRAKATKAKPAEPAREDVHALLADSTAGPPERIVHVCLRANLQAEWEELTAQLDRLQAKDLTTMAGRGRHLREREQKAAEIADVEARMEAATVPLRFRANRAEFQRLRTEHPPRMREDGNGNQAPIPEDGMWVNADTFFEPLIRTMLVDPVLSDDEFDELFARLSDGQLDTVWQAAWEVNRGRANVPFSRAASRTMMSSEPESRQPENSE